MNARLHGITTATLERNGEKTGNEIDGDGIVLNGVCRQVRCTDHWIGRVSGYADFDESHATARCISSRDQVASASVPTLMKSPHGPAMQPDDDTGVSTVGIAAPSTYVTSHTRDNARPCARDSETTFCTARRIAPCTPDASCNVARNIARAPCNLASANCGTMEATSLYRDDRSIAPQLTEETSGTSITKNCQLLGPVDVEDLAMCFDPSMMDSARSFPTNNRATYSKRSRYGQNAQRIDQPRQERRIGPDVGSTYDSGSSYTSSRSCYTTSDDLRHFDPGLNYPARSTVGAPLPSDVAAGDLSSNHFGYSSDLVYDAIPPCRADFNDLETSVSQTRDDLPSDDPVVDPRSRDSTFSDARFHIRACGAPRFGGDSRACAITTGSCVMQEAHEPSRDNNPARSNVDRSDLGPGDWLCYDCPELFNFCSEQRWLQCPASDRCPLYDTATYVYGASTVLPPCMYENLENAGYRVNDNWQYDHTEDEQLLEDYLSNEKRKERSRDAARCRRSRETDIFAELAAALPIPLEQTAHLDKASVMRLAIAYLKVRAVVDSIPPSMKSETSGEMNELFPKALNGFMLILSNDGNMVYLSENVSDYLGVSQMDMMGQSVYEYSHPCDHDELRDCLSSKPTENEDRACNFFLRLKCTLTNKGRKVNLKSASYKVIHCIGRLTSIRDSNSNSMEVNNEEQEKKDEPMEHDTDISLVLVGSPIPHPSNIEVPLGRHTFLSKHSLSMQFTYADEKLAEYLGWSSEELIGQSVFEFYHALDNLALDKCFKCLFSKGQCETMAYRFLGKRGGYAWVVTQATLIHCSKQQKPISVVCVNYILSEIEHEDEVYSERQVAARDSVDLLKSDGSLPPLVPTDDPVDSIQVLDNEKEIPANDITEPAVIDRRQSRSRPIVVTTPIFRSVNGNNCKNDSRKDNGIPRLVQEEKAFVGVQALKDSLEESIKESLKENNEPTTEVRQICRPPLEKTPFIFQGKPAIECDSPNNLSHRDRPQTVTRHLFAPLTQQQQQQEQQQQLSCRPPPQTATASIFAPRTEDMNKGFLTFSEDQPGLTMLKDEPEDLTHLAPTPGDVCVPLEDTPLLSDMLDEFILGNDNYCPLLSPGGALTTELRSSDLGDSLKDADLTSVPRTKDAIDRLANSDPFMYGDSPESPCGIDPNSVSPSLSKYQESPERSVNSLSSPTGGSGGDGLSEDEILMLGISDSIGDDELALRAPYIPMSDQDEALELLINDDMVMWSASQPPDKESSKWLIDDREQRGSESSLAQLLRTDQVASRRYNDHGGGLVNTTQVFGQMAKKNADFDSERWSSNREQIERPNKRIHTPCADSESQHKRLKRASSPFERDVVLAIYPQNISSARQQRLSSTMPRRKSSNLGDTCGSQLLRRLVSQTPGVMPRPYDSDTSSFDEMSNERCFNSPERARVLDDIIDLAETEGDRGGGGGGGGRHQGGNGNDNSDGLNKIDAANQKNPSCATGNSVLMNLLVSGCDDALMDSRKVPNVLSRNVTSPLSVDVNNQMVPRCADVIENSLDHLSPDIRKQLIGSFTDGGRTMISPTTSTTSFDGFDYDVGGSTTGLLQVGPDLLGSLLD